MNIFFESNGFKDLEPKKEEVFYEQLPTTDGKFVFDTSKPLDSEGKPLANPEIVDGINNREVNKAKKG